MIAPIKFGLVGLMRITDTASELHISVGLNVLLVGFIFAAS